jgi:uncharacterized protein DUF4430
MQKLVSHLGRWALPAAVLAVVAIAAPAALAVPAAVTLRVEGNSATTFEGSVTTDGHDVTTASGGTHKCDGTNGGVNPTPGPSATAALDDAAQLGRFTWDGTWSDDFDDYFVTRVGPDSQTQTQFWGVFVNGKASQVGGCQQRVGQGDEVVWAFDAFSKAQALRLTGPPSAKTGQRVVVKVADSSNGAPIAGASVGGSLTGADGQAALSLSTPGIYRLKAERADSVRSNALVMCVDPPSAEPCTSSDKVAPTLKVLLRDGFLFETSTSRTFFLSWQAQDGAKGSGVATYDVDVRELGGVSASQTGWRTLARRIKAPRVRFRGGSGKGYEFRVAAVDRAGNRSPFATARVLVPIDERDRELVRLSRGWRRVARKGAWGGFMARATRRGATMRVRFRGRNAAVIGRRIRNGGRVRVSVDGRSTVRRLRGRDSRSRILVGTRRLEPGSHVLRLRTLGGGPVAIDAIGVEP